MKIDKIFKIKEKYFNAILRFEKPFELRHEPVEPNNIVKLECENGRYLVFKSENCHKLKKHSSIWGKPQYIYINNWTHYLFDEEKGETWYSPYDIYDWTTIFNWYDEFVWDYINEAPTYLIEIAEILDVK